MFDQAVAAETSFSADGTVWTLLDTDDTVDVDGSFTSVAAVGDDEVLLVSNSIAEPPLELLAFEDEGRLPTEAEDAALDEWYSNQAANGTVWTPISVAN